MEKNKLKDMIEKKNNDFIPKGIQKKINDMEINEIFLSEENENGKKKYMKLLNKKITNKQTEVITYMSLENEN